MKPITVAKILGSTLIGNKVLERYNRINIFKKAKEASITLGLPLVNYGCKTLEPFVSQSDINMDIIPQDVPNFVLIEPDGTIPLADNSAVMYVSHVMEHVTDLKHTYSELIRCGPTYIVLPKWYSWSNWLNPRHKRVFIGSTPVENSFFIASSILGGLALLV